VTRDHVSKRLRIELAMWPAAIGGRSQLELVRRARRCFSRVRRHATVGLTAMSKYNTCRVVTGRLCEVDGAAGCETVADVDRMIAMMVEQFARLPEPTRIVIAADWRACRTLTQPVAERVAQMFEYGNARIERGGLLHDARQATSVLQLFRLVREASLPSRRIFTDLRELEDWLAEVLTPEERERVRALLHKTEA
jgi:hypothetical protein